MEKFSIIIPTLWKPKTFPKLLERLQYESRIDEIIIIDNAPKNSPNIHLGAKVQRLEQDNNIFVNPAWNLGVKMASNELICICNDDIFFNINPLLEFVINNSNLMGCFGINPESYNNPLNFPKINPGQDAHRGWGCLIFFKKSSYIPIPSNLKIWYGDNWIIDNIKNPSSITYPIETKMGITSTSPQFQSIIEKDIQEWKKRIKI